MGIVTANENFVVDGENQYGLSTALKVAFVEDGINPDNREEILGLFQTSGGLKNTSVSGNLAPNANKEYGVIIYWEPTANDNNWNANNGKKLSSGDALTIDLGVKLQASQWTEEADAFGKDYDENAQSTILTSVSTASELEEALTNLKSVRLEQDIVLTEEWEPIGDKANGIYFTGILDGNGHTISGLSVNGGDYSALISAAKDATIKNLTVEGKVTADNAAGIVARAEGTTVIENCVSNVDVTGNTKAGGIVCNVTNAQSVTLKNCVNNGDIAGSGTAGLGGMVGYVNTNGVLHVIDCQNNGDITGSAAQYVAAAIGYAAGTESATASRGSVQNFINTGRISGKDTSTDGHKRYLFGSDGTLLISYCGCPANWTASSEITAIVPDNADDKDANGNLLLDEINKSSEETTLTLGAGTYKMPSIGGNKTVTIVGTKDTVIDNTMGSYQEGTKLSFEGVTIKGTFGMVNGNGSDYAALYSPDVTYTNCTFVGPFLIGRDGAKFINCTFTGLDGDYVRTYGNDATFENCTFETAGKALLIYSDGGSEVSKVTVKNCVFNATQGAKAGAIANQNCAAIEIHNYGNGVNLTTSGNTIDDDFSGEWRIKTYESGRTQVFVNGTEYTTIALDGKTMTIDADKNVTVNQ